MLFLLDDIYGKVTMLFLMDDIYGKVTMCMVLRLTLINNVLLAINIIQEK
jgi:hypothetical protein